MSYAGERPWWPIESSNIGRKKKRVRGEGEEIKCIDFRLERGQVVELGKVRGQDVP